MTIEFDLKAEAIGKKLPLAYKNGHFSEVEQELMELQALAANSDERFRALGKLAAHYAFQNDWPKTEKALQERIEIDATRVEGWLGLAEHFHYYNEDLGLALEYAEKALTAAFSSGDFVRQVLGVKIRIALAIGNYSAVEQSLRALVEHKCSKGGLDISFESDFISQIPLDAVSPDLLDSYKALVELR